jgi:two-component system response regulator QseB
MRVLLVEDDRLLGDGLQVGLQQAGCVVDWAQDGFRAQSALEVEEYDVLVLDLGLPRRPGIEVLRWLRGRGSRVPVLILTAVDDVEDRVTALDGGADDYLCKPFHLTELCARLRALHRRSVGGATPTMRYGGIEIDPSARSVTMNGRRLLLSPKEFAILQTLVENAGKVVPRRRLMGSIYGWDDDVAGNALEVHICHIRRKIATDTLKTIRGVGYRLD